MNMLTIKINQQNVLQILLELEKLNLIQITNKGLPIKMKPAKKPSLSVKYGGKLSADIGEDLNIQLTQSREEWNRNF